MRAERTVVAGRHRVVLDLAPQVIALDRPESQAPREALVPRGSPSTGNFVSAALLAHKVKQVDDGVRAAVELMIQRGAGRLPARRLLLGVLADRLTRARPAVRGDAAEVIYAACQVGGVGALVPAALRRAVGARVRAHLADASRSQPLGFYTWSPELTRAFQQDRLLQTVFRDPSSTAAVARLLRDDPRLEAMYTAHSRLDRRLAGRRVCNDLRRTMRGADAAKRAAFFPAAASIEGPIARDGVDDVMGAIVDGVTRGVIDLRPPKNPSWKDLQLWSLEPLLRPERTAESAKLSLSEDYREHLTELFEAIYALTRETHIKNEYEEEECEYGEEDGGEVTCGPGLTVEPLATHYARAADARRFVREVLEECFGTVIDRVPRERPGEKPTRSLRGELVDVESILRGASETARREVGLVPDAGAAVAVARFEAWRSMREGDPDVTSDTRMMVPVSYVGEAVRVWAFLGWTERVITAHFQRCPRVVAERSSARVQIDFQSEVYKVDAPVMVEMWVGERLDRDAFRRVCDRHRTVEEIVRALSG